MNLRNIMIFNSELGDRCIIGINIIYHILCTVGMLGIALIRYGQLNNKITNHNVIPANQASPYLSYNDVRPVPTSLARNVVITAPDRRDELRK